MVIVYMTIGICVGLVSALLAFSAGAPIWLALIVYSGAGSAGTIMTAAVIAGLVQSRTRFMKGMPGSVALR